MNFVNKQNCWLAGGLEAIYCFVHYPSNVVNFGFDRVQAFKLGLGLVGDDLSERGFAGAGWSIENQRSDAVGFNCAFKQFAWSKNVSLTANSSRFRGRIRVASDWFLDAFSSTLGAIPPTGFDIFEDLRGFGNSSSENSVSSCLSFGMAKKQQFSGLFADLPHRKRLALWAFRANQHHRHFAFAFIKLRHKPQLIGAARQTSHRKLAKRAFAGRLRRLIILSALKTAGGIHGDSLCRKVGQPLSTVGNW